jgi:6-phosphofructokinase 1
LEKGKVSFKPTSISIDSKISELFPNLFQDNPNFVEIHREKTEELTSPLRIGVVLSGGQAPGGHNVISGVYDFLKSYHPNSQLFGFLNGPHGIYTDNYIEIEEELMSQFRNQGGFDMICSGRHKIETEEQFQNSLKYCNSLKLDGLIVIGGDDSNTNGCLLAEYFLKNKSSTKVIGVPKTIDGDLKNEWIEVSFGFDTATRVYSELIGNICLDTLSSKKYYHFIRLMGRSASHIALECALQTQVNYVLIGEEVEQKQQTLEEIVDQLANLICQRSQNGKNYGVILVPEGLIEFIPEMNVLIKEINEIVSKKIDENEDLKEFILKNLTGNSQKLFQFLPKAISDQLLLDRDPHGNVQVAKIDTERLLILLLQSDLEKRKNLGNFKGKFSPQSHYFGYEGRCALPSYFDTEYCYSLGYNASALVSLGLNGYMSVIRGLKNSPENWIPGGCPLMTMMNVERRKGKNVPVIKKALVELDGDMYKYYQLVKQIWAENDSYIIPGPIQYEGPCLNSCPFLVNPPSLNFNKENFIININKNSGNSNEKNLPYAQKNDLNMSNLSKFLLQQDFNLPNIFTNPNVNLNVKLSNVLNPKNEESKYAAKKNFPMSYNESKFRRLAEIVDSGNANLLENEILEKSLEKDIKIGVVYNGRQSPGGNNIINGLLKFQENSLRKNKIKISLIGFLYGTLGMFEENYIDITNENFANYKNHGGFDYLGRSVDRIRSNEELEKTRKTCENLNLDGLIFIGATHTLTDSLLVTEHFRKNNVKTNIISIPCSVDGNLKHPLFESCIGFDTASKVYSQLIGNIMTDSASATKYWYFIRLMGRDPSHLVLECALQTRPNYAIISEECEERGQNLADIVNDICDVIVKRAELKKNFGTVLIPEGLLAHLPHFKSLIDELNEIFSKEESNKNNKNENKTIGEKLYNDNDYLKSLLTPWSFAVFSDLPEFTRKQMLLEREAHGSIQLSQIETERLLSYKIGLELERRKKEKLYKGSYAAITHFFGYQGRCSFPSIFDAKLASVYGFTAGVLIQHNLSGYCVTARGLSGDVENWKCAGIPLVSLTSCKGKSQYGENRCVIQSSYVNLIDRPFKELKANRRDWVTGDYYCNPGPIQFFDFGKDFITKTLKLEHENYSFYLKKIEDYCNKIKNSCRFGAHEDLLKATLHGLESVEKIIGIMNENQN